MQEDTRVVVHSCYCCLCLCALYFVPVIAVLLSVLYCCLPTTVVREVQTGMLSV